MSELYELPTGWERKKLGTVLDVQNGYAFDSKLFNEEIGTQLIRIRDLKNGYLTEVKFNGNYDDKFLVYKDDFLIGMDGDFVCYRWKGEPSLLNQRVCRLINFNEKLEAKYVFYGINKYLDDIHKTTAFVTVKHISSKQIKDIEFPLPPLPEQQRIVYKLDLLFEKIDRSIALHQKNMDEADLFMGSVLNEVFTELEEKYPKKQLKDIVDNYDGKRIPIKSSDRDSMKGEYPYYGASGIIDYVNDYIFEGEYLLISEDGANLTVRKYPIAFIASGKFWVNNHAHIVKAKDKISTNKYMEYAFSYTNISDYITGSAQPKMSQGKMNLIAFSMPPLPIQQKVVDYLDEISEKIEKIKSVQKEKMDSLKALKASILDQAFRGEL